jgi:hypothetical protein
VDREQAVREGPEVAGVPDLERQLHSRCVRFRARDIRKSMRCNAVSVAFHLYAVKPNPQSSLCPPQTQALHTIG